METSHDDWLERNLELIADFQDRGLPFIKVDVDLDKLIRWCRDRELPVDGNSRAMYAAEMARSEETGDD